MWIIWTAVGVLFVAAAVVAGLAIRRRSRAAWRIAESRRAREEFHRHREWLEVDFLKSASESGKPRGLAWADCQFADEVSFARDRQTGEMRALVAVTISFEAIEGGGMEDNPNVGNLRVATAVFRRQDGTWVSDGRALFNLNPHEAILRYQHELEIAD